MLWPYSDPAAVLGLLIDLISGGIANLVGLTGLFAGAAHYGAVLADWPQKKVERITGAGFFVGFALGLALAAAEAIV